MLKVLVLLLLAAAGTACGGDGSPTVASQPPGDASRVDGSPPSSARAGDGAGACRDETDTDGPADIEMQDFSFTPSCLEISSSQGLLLHNEGDVEHNWSVEGVSGLDVDVSPGDANTTEATGLLPGTFTFFCKYHRERNAMEGTLVVKGP